MTDTQAAAPGSEAAEWFYEEGGRRQGPVPERQIIEMIRSQRLGYGSSVWHKSLPDWARLSDTPFLAHLQNTAPPPLLGSNVNNKVVWVLAFAPLIGRFLEAVLALLVHSNEYAAERALNAGHFFYVSLALNIALSLLDERLLKRAGHDTSKLRAWLVPVYLYQRAQQLRQNLAYFVVWLVCFAAVLVF